jgi:hypothetical protein
MQVGERALGDLAAPGEIALRNPGLMRFRRICLLRTSPTPSAPEVSRLASGTGLDYQSGSCGDWAQPYDSSSWRGSRQLCAALDPSTNKPADHPHSPQFAELALRVGVELHARDAILDGEVVTLDEEAEWIFGIMSPLL